MSRFTARFKQCFALGRMVRYATAIVAVGIAAAVVSLFCTSPFVIRLL
jgi:hypothetical protein